MERKIGEVFEYEGEWYQCVKGDSCGDCSFLNTACATGIKYDKGFIGECSGARRDTSVIFKKLEKFGTPFSCSCHGDNRLIMMQEYRAYDTHIIPPNGISMFVTDYQHKRVAIEIQKQENMEEKKLTYKELRHYYDTTVGLWVIDRSPQEVDLKWIVENAFQLCIDTKHSNSESIGKNLKPFDLKSAKAGKSVCTRDGRKVRIVCFDVKGSITPIIALVANEDGDESACLFHKDGRVYDDRNNDSDLMMLPEKYEGWVNVYKVSNGYEARKIFETENEARGCAGCGCISTIRVEWEE